MPEKLWLIRKKFTLFLFLQETAETGRATSLLQPDLRLSCGENDFAKCLYGLADLIVLPFIIA